MKQFFSALVLCMVGIAHAATPSALSDKFPGAAVLKLNTLMPGADTSALPLQITYDAAHAVVINKKLKENEVFTTTRLIQTNIDRNGKPSFFIDFEPGSSLDPTFIISASNGKKSLGEIPADQLIVPGDGFLYAIARSNQNHVQHRKYAVRGSKLVEIKQPFLYAGVETTARNPFTIFSAKGKGEIIAGVEKGERLTVVLSDGDYLLIKTRGDLLGWLKLNPALATRDDRIIDDIYYAGD